MPGTLIAYCGLNCAECDAYIATQSGDEEALKKLAETWSKQYNTTFTIETCTCDGCVPEGHKCGYCSKCEVRACAVERAVENCAHCADYACEKLTAFFQLAPQAKVNLEEIRLSLV